MIYSTRNYLTMYTIIVCTEGGLKMRVKKFFAAMLVSAVALTLLAGCGGSGAKSGGADAKTVKVGVFLPLTGDNAAGGELELRGIKLANKLYPEIRSERASCRESV